MAKGIKIFGLCILLFVTVLLLADTNQNPISFIERVLKPIHIEGSVFYYANFLVLIAAYYILKKLFDLIPIDWFNNIWRRLLALAFVIILLTNFQEGMMKSFKSMQSGVDSIYLYRDEMNIDVQTKEEKEALVVTITGNVSLENLSNTPREFQMKVSVLSDFYEQIFDKKWTEVYPDPNLLTYMLQGKRKHSLMFWREIHIDKTQLHNLKEEYMNRSERRNTFEVMLYDEKTNAYFQVGGFASDNL